MAIVTPRINQIKLSDGEHEIAARYLRDSSNGDHTYEDIVSLINAVGLELVIDSAKTGSATKEPNTTADSTTQGKIYLVPDDSDLANGTYIEWVTVDKGASANPRYVWEQIGTTAVDIQGLQTSNDGAQTINTSSAGQQSATVSGSITYSKAPANTGKTTPAFTGTAATITSTGSYTPAGSISGSQTVAAHSHTVNVSKDSTTTYVTTAAIKSAALATTTATTGITVPVTLNTTATAVEDHSHTVGSTTASIYQITGVGTAPALTISDKTVATNGIKSYPGAFAKLAQGTGYGAGTTTVYGAGTTTVYGTGTTTVYGTAAVNNAMTAPTVSTDGVLSWTLAKVSNGTSITVSNGTSRTVSDGTAVTVANSTSFTYATGATVATTATGGAQIMTGLGTAVAADTTTVGSASGWSAGSVPTRSAVTVVTGVDASTGASGGHSHTLSGGSVGRMTVTTAAASTVSRQYVTGATTSTAGGVTISGSNFSFTGTAATITVKADYTPAGTVAEHSHSITVANATASHSLSAAVASHTHSVTVASHTHDIIKQS